MGQLNPNGFIHINYFQASCLEARVKPKTSLFWYHYKFKRNAKSHSFYSISRRVGRADWAATSSNNQGNHEEWFYISGPKTAKYSTWRHVDPTQLIMPDLILEEDNEYIALNDLGIG